MTWTMEKLFGLVKQLIHRLIYEAIHWDSLILLKERRAQQQNTT